MFKKFDKYDGFVWYLISGARKWGYRLLQEDINDLFQEAQIAVWKSEGVTEELTLKNIKSAISKALYHIVDKSPSTRAKELPSLEEFLIDQDSLIDEKLIQEEEFEKKLSLLQNNLTEKEIETILEIADKKILTSLYIPNSEFSDVKKKIAYLRNFTDSLLSPLEKDVAKVYTEVLLGLRNRFPDGFRSKNAPFLVKYLFNNILEKDPAKVDQSYVKILIEYKLGGVVNRDRIMKTLKKAYPEKKPWEFRRVIRWTDEMLASVIAYVAEQENLSQKDVTKKHLLKHPKIYWKISHQPGGLSLLLKNTLPIEEYLLTKTKIMKRWDDSESDEHAHIAIDFLVEQLEKDYNLKLEDVPKFFRTRAYRKDREIFKKYGLTHMLGHKFNYSIYNVFNFHYPKRFYPWEFSPYLIFKNLEKNENKEKRAAKATEWFVKEKLGLKNPRDIIKYKKPYILEKMQENGVGGVAKYFNRSLYGIFSNAYSNTFKPTDFLSKTSQKISEPTE